MNSDNSNTLPQIWGIIPAAGIGQRMQSGVPKQYLTINDKSVLQHSCERLLEVDAVAGLVVAIRVDDPHWQTVAKALQTFTEKPVYRVSGGKERADSVQNALQYLLAEHDTAPDTMWALVHDAVRPCVRKSDIQLLIDTVLAKRCGGLLAVPVRDTMKLSNAQQHVETTVARENLWHALTPQCFPLQILNQALLAASNDNKAVTDESSAMEMSGQSPILVQGADDNIKITRPGDLQLAQLTLSGNPDE